jgi:hypothetical protein
MAPIQVHATPPAPAPISPHEWNSVIALDLLGLLEEFKGDSVYFCGVAAAMVLCK